MDERKSWVTDTEVAGLIMGRTAVQPETPVAQAKRIIKENAPMAAMSLVRLAQYGEAEQVRLRASIEILNRAEQLGQVDGKEPWADLIEGVTQDAELHANGK